MDQRVGRIAPGMVADLLVIRDRGTKAGPARALIEANEEDVKLVVVGGRALYGEPKALGLLAGARSLEKLAPGVCGQSEKVFALDYASGARTLDQISRSLTDEIVRGASLLPEKVRGALGPEFLKLDPICETGDSRYLTGLKQALRDSY
jgi:hypothetical protein